MEKFLSASKKTASVIAKQVNSSGKLNNPEVCDDLCSHYKLPTLLLISGYTKEAHKVLDRIKLDFMQSDGDFLSFPDKTGRDRKSASFPMTHYWSYMNAWVAMGAHRLGRFDISYPAFEICKTYYHPGYRMACVSEPLKDTTTDSTMDVLSTAHFGLLCLYMGDLDLAMQCGEGLVQFLTDQPDVQNQFYLRASVSTGQIITTAPANMEPFYTVKKDSPNQLYFFIGYYIIFMTKLYQATKEMKFLESAKTLLDFALTCHESICVFSFSHKVAYGAALVAVETKEAKYRRFAIAIGEYLMSIQTDEGMFCAEMDPIDKYDQSSEIAIWLREIDNELKRLKD